MALRSCWFVAASLATASCASQRASPTPTPPTSPRARYVSAPADTSDGVVRQGSCPAFDEYLSRLSGAGVVDCGAFSPDTPRDEAWRCVAEAERSAAPFRVVLRERGKDSELATAWVRSVDGILFRIRYDSDPSGGGNVGATITRWQCAPARLNESSELTEQGVFFPCDSAGAPPIRCER